MIQFLQHCPPVHRMAFVQKQWKECFNIINTAAFSFYWGVMVMLWVKEELKLSVELCAGKMDYHSEGFMLQQGWLKLRLGHGARVVLLCVEQNIGLGFGYSLFTDYSHSAVVKVIPAALVKTIRCVMTWSHPGRDRPTEKKVSLVRQWWIFPNFISNGKINSNKERKRLIYKCTNWLLASM